MEAEKFEIFPPSTDGGGGGDNFLALGHHLNESLKCAREAQLGVKEASHFESDSLPTTKTLWLLQT